MLSHPERTHRALQRAEMLSGARWVEEEVAETMQLMVPVTIELRKEGCAASRYTIAGWAEAHAAVVYLPAHA